MKYAPSSCERTACIRVHNLGGKSAKSSSMDGTALSLEIQNEGGARVIQEMEDAASTFAHRLVQPRTATVSQTMDLCAESEPYGWCFVALWK